MLFKPMGIAFNSNSAVISEFTFSSVRKNTNQFNDIFEIR